jgi:hypothetical protein
MEDNDNVTERDFIKGPPKAKPFIRFWARYFDTFLHIFLFIVIWGLIDEESFYNFSPISFAILSLIFWMLIEGIYLSVFGTTPGKKLFKIKVRTVEDGRLTVKQSFQRAFLVWYRGMGLGLGIAQVIANIIGGNRLSATGVTTWDRDLKLIVTHEKVGLPIVLLCAFFVLGLLVLSYL